MEAANATGMPDKAVVQLDLPTTQLQAWYRGRVTHVQAMAEDGRNIRLPLFSLRPHFSHAGLQGRFFIEFDDAGKCLKIGRLQK